MFLTNLGPIYNPLCEDKLVVCNREGMYRLLSTSSSGSSSGMAYGEVGISCKPCINPVPYNLCCCNCFRLDWPDFDFEDTESCPGEDVRGNLNGADSSLFRLMWYRDNCFQVPSSGDCSWEGAAYDSHEGIKLEYNPGTAVGSTLMPMQLTVYGAVYSGHGGGLVTECTSTAIYKAEDEQFHCNQFRMQIESPSDRSLCCGYYWPEFLELVPIDCV